MKITEFSYRPEIDGLRALAVIPVILFHANTPGFTGGFVGVDVFFVISGYLITSLILKDLNGGSFSLLEFYERRARRIFPALILVMAVTLVLALAVLLPGDLQNLGSSTSSAALSASNFYFWQNLNYFSVRTELLPLIHTWSLAIEEQYYLLFPPLMMAMWKWTRRWIIPVLTIALLVSLVLAELTSTRMPAAAFYLLPMRAWELLLGVLSAILLSRTSITPAEWLRDLAALTGIVMIGGAVYWFDHNIPFPGLFALIPTIGTVLIILFASGSGIVGRILSNPLLVGIGLLSYSAYLWHQPLFALARHGFVIDLEPYILAILIAVTFALSYLSWRFVERPFRNRANFSRKAIFTLSVCGLLGLALAGGALRYSDGLPGRFDPTVLSLMGAPHEGRKNPTCIPKARDGEALRGEVANCYREGKTIYLVGSSHADRIAPALHAAMQERGFTIISLAEPGCIPLSGVEKIPNSYRCDVLRDNAADIVAEYPGPVIFSIRWRLVLSGEPFDNGEGGVEFFSRSIVTIDGEKENLHAAMATRLRQWADTTPLLLIGQVPEAGWHVRKMMVHRIRFGQPHEVPLSTSYARYFNANAENIRMLNELDKHPAIAVVDPSPIVCSAQTGRCLNELNGEPLYVDDDHVSQLYAAKIVEAVIKQLDDMPMRSETR